MWLYWSLAGWSAALSHGPSVLLVMVLIAFTRHTCAGEARMRVVYGDNYDDVLRFNNH